MARTPNILWVVTTQWRASACGYAGDPNARTPHLDRLAAQSVNYAQTVTPHPFGPFARAALLTGVLSPENGVRDYFDPLPTAARTVAHGLNERGYTTAFFGKWHLARRDPVAPLVGEAHARMIVPAEARGGFKFWEGFESGFLLNDPWLHGSRLPVPERFPGYQSDVLVRRAGAWLGAQAAPWFALVSLEAPHPPYAAPAAGVEPREPGAIELAANVPRGGEFEARVRRELAGYYAHIEATDRAIGELVAAAGDDAWVVFTSVHGDLHGAHGLLRKGWPQEEAVRVPLLVRAPGTREARGSGFGVSSPALVSLVELTGWALAWAEGGEPETHAEPGTEFQRISMPSVVALPHQCDRVWRGVRTRERKLVLNADGSPWLLFDLANDPFEQRNLAAERAWCGEVERLRAEMG